MNNTTLILSFQIFRNQHWERPHYCGSVCGGDRGSHPVKVSVTDFDSLFVLACFVRDV